MRVHKPESNAPGNAETTATSRRGVAGGLRIVGDIRGSDDLLIAGVVSGTVYLPDCVLRVAPEARVRADMTARFIEIEGQVTGRLVASERIAIRSSSVVTGDLVAPKIQIDEGCKFKGSVQMRDPDIKHEAPTGSRPAANE